MALIVLSLRDKGDTSKPDPPIEIGGYKHSVPNGTESMRNISSKLSI
jgi:hypothetical protein